MWTRFTSYYFTEKTLKNGNKTKFQEPNYNNSLLHDDILINDIRRHRERAQIQQIYIPAFRPQQQMPPPRLHTHRRDLLQLSLERLRLNLDQRALVHLPQVEGVVVAEGDHAPDVGEEDQPGDGGVVLVLAVELDAGSAEHLDGPGGGTDAYEAERGVPREGGRLVREAMLEGLKGEFSLITEKIAVNQKWQIPRQRLCDQETLNCMKLTGNPFYTGFRLL